MTYAKFDKSHTDDQRWIAAGADAFALHVAAVVWCDGQLNDGAITEAMAHRVSLAVSPERANAAVAALVGQGFWTATGDGAYQIVKFHQHAFPAEQVKRTRARWNADKERKRQHNNGDHTLCKDPKWCPAIRDGSTVEAGPDSATDSTTGSSRNTKPNPTQPNPTEGKGLGKGKGADDTATSDRSASLRSADSATSSGGPTRTPPGPPPGMVPSVEAVMYPRKDQP